MQESIALRRRIDRIQEKQNAMLLTFLKQSEADAKTEADSRRTSENFNTQQEQLGVNGMNSLNSQGAMNHYILGSQMFDINAALNFMLGNPNLLSSGLNLTPQNLLRQPPLSVPTSSDLITLTQQNLAKNPSTLSKVLNVLTKEHQKNIDFSSASLQD